MSEKKKIYKPKPISGFPEWLPETRRAEQQWFDHIRRVFESYGFCSIETPSVEALDAINAKGGDGGADTDKEMYVLNRLLSELSYEIIHKDETVPEHYSLIPIRDHKFPEHKLYETGNEPRLALHFDQTVPLARYTAQHFNELVFPFKRYQMQRVWRGERPQAGRFREFYQCDIDVINVDTLPLHFDAEMPAIIWEILSSLPGMEDEKIQIQISNRKILIGLLEGLGIENITEVTRWIDKLDKMDKNAVASELIGIGLSDDNIDTILSLALIKASTSKELIAGISTTNQNDTMKEGIEELSFVLDQLQHLPDNAVVADLSIVRGLDYYTGTVYETRFLDDPSYGSICSGGRYDDLAGNYINKHLPGVGISIGFSRLFDRIRIKNQLPVSGVSPADILVILPNEESRNLMMATAQTLRKRGYNVETFHGASKIKRQLAYAQKKGIPYVWFPPFEDGQSHEVKNMETGAQENASPEEWTK